MRQDVLAYIKGVKELVHGSSLHVESHLDRCLVELFLIDGPRAVEVHLADHVVDPMARASQLILESHEQRLTLERWR